MTSYTSYPFYPSRVGFQGPPGPISNNIQSINIGLGTQCSASSVASGPGLQIANSTSERKLVLYDNAQSSSANDYNYMGFGSQGNQGIFEMPDTTSYLSFRTALSATTRQEVFKVRGIGGFQSMSDSSIIGNLATDTLTSANGIASLGTINVKGLSGFQSAMKVTDTTDSTSLSTGSLVLSGGLAVNKNVYLGSALNTTAFNSNATNTNFINTTDATSSTAAAVTIQGGLGIAKSMNIGTSATIGTSVNIGSSTSSSSNVNVTAGTNGGNTADTSTSLISMTKSGITNQSYASGASWNLYRYSTSNTYSNTELQMWLYAGNGVNTKVWSYRDDGSAINFSQADSSSASTGSLVLNGGLGVAKNVYLGSGIYFSSPNGNSLTCYQFYVQTGLTLYGIPTNGSSNVTLSTNFNYKVVRTGNSCTILISFTDTFSIPTSLSRMYFGGFGSTYIPSTLQVLPTSMYLNNAFVDISMNLGNGSTPYFLASKYGSTASSFPASSGNYFIQTPMVYYYDGS